LLAGWDALRMGEPGPLGGGEGAAGLIWLLDKEPGGFRSGEQALLDLVAGQDTTGDEAVEADSRLVQAWLRRPLGAWATADSSCSRAVRP
jgi:GAF domain-containing protein